MKRFVLTGCVFLLAVPMFLTACGSSSDGPPPPNCNYVYDNITGQGQEWVVKYHEQSYFANGGLQTLTATKSTTVTVSADAGVEADLEAIVAGVKAQLHISVSYSVTTSITEATTVTVPAGDTLYGDYGLYVLLASGHLYSPNCGRDYGSRVSSHIPMHTGWCTLVTPGRSPAPDQCESSSPTSTPSPTSEPSPAPTSFLYQADQSHGWNGWTSPGPGGSSDHAWSVSNGELVSSGQPITSPSFSGFSTITPPYQPGQAGISDYAVEVQIRLNQEIRQPVGGENNGFGIGVRRYFDGQQDEGYGCRVVDTPAGENYIALYQQPDAILLLKKDRLSLDNGWHTYRIEVRGSSIKIFVDGSLVFSYTDSRFTNGGRVELWEEFDLVSVRSFTISKF